MRPVALALVLLCFGCSASRPPFCGQSFCIIEKPSAVSKTTSVDFNLYRIDYGGRHFLIYEGNAPQRGEDLGRIGPDLVPAGFVEGELFKRQGQFSLVLRTPNPRFPNYIGLSVDTNDASALQLFASKLRAKQVCRDCP
jgi:hypothetical protein